MKKLGLVSFALLSATHTSAPAQTVNESNYRQYAVCTETVINGKQYNTFGAGPCPVGSRRPNSNGSTDVNAQNWARTMGAVNALGAAQQSLLAAGRARSQRLQEESVRLLTAYEMEIPAAELPSTTTKYETTARLTSGTGMIASGAPGQALASTREGFYAECIVASSPFERKVMGGGIIAVKAGEPACKLSAKEKGYTPSYANYVSGGIPFVYSQFVDFKDGTYRVCLREMGMKFGCLDGIPANTIKVFTGFVGTTGSDRGVLVYDGLRDGKLKFSYSPNGVGRGSEGATDISVDPTRTREVAIGQMQFELLDWSAEGVAVRRKQ